MALPFAIRYGEEVAFVEPDSEFWPSLFLSPEMLDLFDGFPIISMPRSTQKAKAKGQDQISREE